MFYGGSEPITDMPSKPFWLRRLPEITESLRTLPSAIIDRPAFESIFQLRRRRAIELMHLLGSRRGGRGFVLDRHALLDRLQSLETVAQFRWDQEIRSPRTNGHAAYPVNGTNGHPARPDAVNGSNGHHLHGSRHVVIHYSDNADLTEKLLTALRAVLDGPCEPLRQEQEAAGRKPQFAWFEQAVRALGRRQYEEARSLFARACAGPDEKIRTSAEQYLRVCERRIAEAFEARSFDEHYTYGVALLNARRLDEARGHFEQALRMKPDADYMYYTLAACLALSGNLAGAGENLRRAIELQPRNRIAARQDPDFEDARKHPEIEELLGALQES